MDTDTSIPVCTTTTARLSGRSRCRRAPMKTTSRPPMTRGSSPCRSVFPEAAPAEKQVTVRATN